MSNVKTISSLLDEPNTIIGTFNIKTFKHKSKRLIKALKILSESESMVVLFNDYCDLVSCTKKNKKLIFRRKKFHNKFATLNEFYSVLEQVTKVNLKHLKTY